jgi:hypothetical protein
MPVSKTLTRIPPRAKTFGPVVATCLDLGVVARFAPLREPWRNGLVEHFNDVWDKSCFRTARYPTLQVLRDRNAVFETFHNARHRYSAHGGASPDEVRTGLVLRHPPGDYRPPDRLPAKGRIEAPKTCASSPVTARSSTPAPSASTDTFDDGTMSC